MRNQKVGLLVASLAVSSCLGIEAVHGAIGATAPNKATATATPKTTAVPAPAAPSANKTAAAEVAALIDRGDDNYINGETASAEAAFQKALAAAEAAADTKLLIDCLGRLAECNQTHNGADEEALRRRAMELATRYYGAKSQAFAVQLAQLAGTLAHRGTIDEAATSLEQSQALLSGATGENGYAKAIYLINEAGLQIARGLPALAEDSLKEAETLLEPEAQNKFYLVLALNKHALLLDGLDRKAEAKVVREKIALTRGLRTASGGTSAPSASGAFDEHVKAAQLAMFKTDRDGANVNWRLALKEAEKGPTADGRQAFVLVHLSDLYALDGKNAEAEAMLKRALEMRQQNGATNTPGMARNLCRLAKLSMERKDFAQAENLLWKALGIEDACGASDTILAATLMPLSSACTMTRNINRSETVCRRIIDIASRGQITNAALMRSMATGMLGSIYMQTGRLEQGMNLMKQLSASAMNLKPPTPEAASKAAMEDYMKSETAFDEAEMKTFSN